VHPEVDAKRRDRSYTAPERSSPLSGFGGLVDEDGSVLARILSPLDERTFFSDYWGRKPLVLDQGNLARFDGLFDLADLEEYLFVARPPAGDVQLVQNGEWPPLRAVSALMTGPHYDIQAIYNGLHDGYTVVLNAVHYRWPSMRRLTSELEDRLLAHVQTNIYITGPKAQGFALHQDDHDVLVLQTVGTKRWEVRDNPVTPTTGGHDLHLRDGFELRRGDALYLPMGYPHAAATTDDYSIHVSVGIFPLTWQRLAHECIDVVASTDSRWREPVLASGASPEDSPTLAELERRVRDGLEGLGNLSSVMERYRRGLEATGRRKNPPPGGYLLSMRALEHLNLQTEVERRSGVGCFVASDSSSAQIHFMGETVRGPLTVEKALRFIAATPRFRVEQIDPGLPDASKLVLVRRLVREGLLQLRVEAAP
jgi:hypothetical protein